MLIVLYTIGLRSYEGTYFRSKKVIQINLNYKAILIVNLAYDIIKRLE